MNIKKNKIFVPLLFVTTSIFLTIIVVYFMFCVVLKDKNIMEKNISEQKKYYLASYGINQKFIDINEKMKSILDQMYPVGSIYISVDKDKTNPSELFGGEWEPFSVGKTLVGQDGSADFTAGNSGGSKSLQSHSHTIPSPSLSGGGEHTHTTQHNTFTTGGSGSNHKQPWIQKGSSGTFTGTTSGGGSHSHTVGAHSTNEAGTGNSGNLQPYIVVSIWKRIS